MIAQPQPLIEVFAEIPDFRRCRGKRHPLPAMLSLACCAMLCGYRSYSAIAEWGHNYGTRIAQALGFTHNTPCAATLHTVFRHVERDTLEAKLGAWAEQVVVSLPTAPSAGEAAIALDGKTLRGSRKQGAPGVHLLSALSHRLGLTLAQQAVDPRARLEPRGHRARPGPPGARRRRGRGVRRAAAPLVLAAVDNAVRMGDLALTGPVHAGTRARCAAHVAALAAGRRRAGRGRGGPAHLPRPGPRPPWPARGTSGRLAAGRRGRRVAGRRWTRRPGTGPVSGAPPALGSVRRGDWADGRRASPARARPRGLRRRPARR